MLKNVRDSDNGSLWGWGERSGLADPRADCVVYATYVIAMILVYDQCSATGAANASFLFTRSKFIITS